MLFICTTKHFNSLPILSQSYENESTILGIYFSYSFNLTYALLLANLFIIRYQLTFYSINSFPGKPKIVSPFPDNLFAIEDEKAQVSCTMKDSEGATPTKILFYRKNKYGDTNLIEHEGINGRRHYVNKTSGDICMRNHIMLHDYCPWFTFYTQ